MATRRLFVDLTPLRRHRDFRSLMTAQLCSSFASQFVAVAIPLQVYETTHHSSLQVGLVSLAQLLPMLFGSMLGGMIADSHDRKAVMWSMQALLTLSYLGFALDAAAHTGAIWPLYLIAAVSSAIAGTSQPARWAVVPAIVGTEEIAPASSIMQVVSNVTMVAGPSIGGLLLAQIGFARVYVIAAVASGVSIACFAAMAPLAPAEGARRVSIAAMVEGFRYLHHDKVLSSSFYLDFEAMVFGMPRAVFPALALVAYHGGAATYGLLSAAPAIGALLSALVSGWVNNIRRQGLGIVVCVLIWGATIGTVGVIHVLWVGLVLLAIAGGADMVSVVFRNTILQTTVPDQMRGRLTASFLALAMAGNRLGDTEAGIAASIGGAPFAVWSGGLACIVGALVFAWRVPQLLAYDQHARVESTLSET
jgi:hypothetical protein